jgi:LPXTG-site transpeptidase (sortase) family protein
MRIKRFLMSLPLAVGMIAAMSVCAGAADYSFDGVKSAEYYPSTSYESVYGAQYTYGGTNVVDYDIPDLPYGLSSNTSIGVMEKVQLSGQTVSSGIISVDVSGIGSSITTPLTSAVSNNVASIVYQPTAYTSVANMQRSDGSIGTVTIPSLGINMTVWEGETNTSMAKGLGHYSSTSGWDGNVGVCGHNRGAKYVIGSIKDLNIGDTITYTTIYGTRTYAVTLVKTISNTDWSYLQTTSDNRITLTTCLADQPTKRVCVQAVEVQS